MATMTTTATVTTTASTTTLSHHDSNARKEKLNKSSKTTRALPSALFLHGSDWVFLISKLPLVYKSIQSNLSQDSLNLTPYESETCKIAFDNLCLLAWESDNLSSWRIESELGIISSEWAEKKKGPGKAIMRDALSEALKSGWRVRV
ncbi:hypothetical protein DSL72_002787 [Monilinia vaccinii-corymbosi]|uniref:Uncharacterized protein n=1 Tax=Monilinia vaccinii-corymbosi TaxID=61207 RepID=A0A8A3PDR6_9HELO|nr:hypothetical protein DSL72_002787 [Monilinia vaccinii-corymbosi]